MVMNIRLSIVGAARPDSHVFGEEGGTFGRSQKCDWVLADEERILSSVHGRILFRNGGFYMFDESTNGIFPDGAEEPLGRGTAAPVASGDRFHAGRYLIEAQIVDVQRPSRARQSPPPAARLEPDAGYAPAEADTLDEVLASDELEAFWPETTQEPLSDVEIVSADDGLADIFPSEHAFEAPVSNDEQTWEEEQAGVFAVATTSDEIIAPFASEGAEAEYGDDAPIEGDLRFAPVPPVSGGAGQLARGPAARAPYESGMPTRGPADARITGRLQGESQPEAPVYANGHAGYGQEPRAAQGPASTAGYPANTAAVAPQPRRAMLIPEDFDPLSVLPSRRNAAAPAQRASQPPAEMRRSLNASVMPQQSAAPAPYRPAEPPRQYAVPPQAPQPIAEGGYDARPRPLSPSLMADLVEPGVPEDDAGYAVAPANLEALKLRREYRRSALIEKAKARAGQPQPAATNVHMPPATDLPMPPMAPVARVVAPAMPVQRRAPVAAPATVERQAPMPTPQRRQAPTPPAAPKKQAPAAQRETAPAPAARVEGDRAVLSALLSAMGFPRTEIDPRDHLALVSEAGEMLRAMSEGLIALLAARRMMSSERRMDDGEGEDNNPFKVFKIAELALDEMFVTRSGGYESPVEATRSAFEDLQQHMSLSVAAMERAITLLFERLSPDEIGNDRTEDGGLRIPGLSAKKNKWEAYVESHAKMSRNIDAVARQIIGEALSQVREQERQRGAKDNWDKSG
jgi:FHA domain-containing protein